MPSVILSKSEKILRSKIQHFNENKYWKYRDAVISYKGGEGIIRYFICKRKLLYIKKCDAFIMHH